MPPRAQVVLGLPDLNHEQTNYENKKIIVWAKLNNRPHCPHCAATHLHIKDSFKRTLKHTRLGNQCVLVMFMAHKYHCQGCKKYFNTRLQGVLPKRQSSEAFRLEVYEAHHVGVSQRQLAVTHDISHATVERWYTDFLKARLGDLKGRKTPSVLGIDEHFFTKKQGYATTFADLKTHKVFDVVLGRSEQSLENFLKKLPDKHRVKIVVMDLSRTYRSIVRKYFPNALIVADRFHVVRLINHQFLIAWNQFDPVGRKNRGLLSLMRRHEDKLKPEQKMKLEKYFQEYPHMKVIWEFKQKLHNLMKKKMLAKTTTWLVVHDFLHMLHYLKTSPIPALNTLGETLSSWRNEIGRMWRFSKTNSITEGLHNKMEMISRRAFGFRNFKNYRLRVLALCGWDGIVKRTRKLVLVKNQIPPLMG